MDKVLFRVDSSTNLGGGHLSRCIEIAKLLYKKKIKVFFLCKNLKGNLNEWVKSEKFELLIIKDNYKTIKEELKDIENLLKPLLSFKYLIIDNYSIEKEWENEIKKIIPKIVVIDDLANRNHNCDILIDQNYVENHKNRYKKFVSEKTIKLLSPKYAIIKDSIKKYEGLSLPNFKNPSKLFICFGATDPKGYTIAALNALNKIRYKFQLIYVFTSKNNKNLEKINQKSSTLANCKIYTDNRLLPEMLAQSDLAIGAGGIMCWERAFLGIPSLVFGIANNQTQVLEALIKNGIVIGESYSKYPDDNKIESWLKVIITNQKLLEGLSERSRKIVDGFGTERICEALFPEEIKFRYADDQDSKNIFKWRNLPAIRNVSNKKDVIEFKDHQKWFANCIYNRNIILLIAESNQQAVGVIRFDLKNNQASISIYKTPSNVKTFGLIKKVTSWLFKKYPEIISISADIIPDNVNSYEAFFSAGYKQLNFKLIKERIS